MKVRILVLALVTALLGASAALADSHPGKPGHPTTGPGCKPSVGIKLKGTLANDPATADTSSAATWWWPRRIACAFAARIRFIDARGPAPHVSHLLTKSAASGVFGRVIRVIRLA